MTRIAIIGATSAIAQACARKWAARGADFVLVGRNPERLSQNASDLAARGAGMTEVFALDLNRIDEHPGMLERCFASPEPLDIVLIAHGTLPDQAACETDVDLALREFSSNGLSVIALLTRIAGRMQTQGRGTIAVISSVAGDRGRPSNYLYGSAKAAVTTFCSGLRGRLHPAGVRVLTIRPGFVDTPMTAGLPLPRPLVASPEAVAQRIVSAIDAGRDDIYVPGFWFLIMFAIRAIPTVFFKRLKL